MNTHDVLADLVPRARCKPGWSFEFTKAIESDGSLVLRLIISVRGLDSRAEGEHELTIRHYFPVPDATFNMKSWRRWLFEMCRKVENHELGEWFRIDDERPFSPCHAPGEDPYTVHEYRDEVDARTNQRGDVA